MHLMEEEKLIISLSGFTSILHDVYQFIADFLCRNFRYLNPLTLLLLFLLLRCTNYMVVQCHIHKSPPLIPILSRINPIHHIDIYIFEIYGNIALGLYIGLYVIPLRRFTSFALMVHVYYLDYLAI